MIKRFFKRIGRGIKKAFKKIGKFFGKMGIIGQIGLMMFLPGIGGALMKGLGNVAGKLIAGNAGILKGVGHVLKGAHSFVQGGINAFRTVTEGVTSFVSQFTKTAASKLGFNVTDAAPDFFGKGGAWERVQSGIVQNAKSILDPFRSNITITQGMQDSLIDNQTNLDIVSRNTGISKDMLTRLNPDSAFKVGDVINVDVGTLQPIPNGEIVDGLSGMTPEQAKNAKNYAESMKLEREQVVGVEKPVVPDVDYDTARKTMEAQRSEIYGGDAAIKFPEPETVVERKPSYLDMSVPETVTPKVSVDSIIADKSVEVKSSLIGKPDTVGTKPKVGIDPSSDLLSTKTQPKSKGLVGGFIDDFQEKPLKTASGAVTAYQTLAADGTYPDYGGYTGVVQAEQAAPVGSYADENYFGPGLNTYSWADQMHLSMGTPSLFNNDNEWNNWLNTSFAGQNR